MTYCHSPNKSTARFLRPDPLASDYHPISPYAFCANNPLVNTDPTGLIVRALDESSKDNILNTVGRDEAKYVSFDDNVVDSRTANLITDPSENMKALITLINSDIEYIFINANTYPVGDKNNELHSNPIDGVVGVTLIPNAEKDPSPDNNVYIFTSSSLPKEKQVSNTAHEAYGHAYFYELNRLGHDVNPFHIYGFISLPKEIDPVDGSVSYPFIKTDTNLPLKNQIRKSEKEAVKNYKSRTSQ